MYYTKFIMKNNVIKLIKYLYYFSLITLSIIYLFPGSIIGYFFFGDLDKQPNFIPNPIGTSINHTIAFFYISILGLINYLNFKSFYKTIMFLILLSIILEFNHYFIPNRSFQFLDLFANLLGILLASIVIIFYKKFKKIL